MLVEDNTSFGTWIKRQRRAKRITQEELARQTHCATVTIRKIEGNERHPSPQLAALLANALGVTPTSKNAFLEFARIGRSSQPIIVDTAPQLPELECVQRRPSRKLPPVQHFPAYLIDASSDRLLLDVKGQQRLPIASTTKIMTALIAIEQSDLRQQVTVKHETLELVRRYRGHSTNLQAGDQILLKDLLYALMLPSGDDAAFVIAETVSGSVKDFVRLMNHYARHLHLADTFYINPSGTPFLNALVDNDAHNYSTAANLVSLTQYALHLPLFAQIVQLQRYALACNASHHAYSWETTNDLLSSYAGATGVKTGYTRDAGSCLVFSATSGRQQLVGAVLRTSKLRQRFTEAHKLLDWGFSSHT